MSFDGTWDLTVQSPMGAKTFRLVVTTGEGGVQGTVAVGGETSPMVEPRVEDGHFRWSVRMPRPMNVMLDVDLTRDGDTLAGTAKAGHMPLPGVSGGKVS